MTSSAECCEQFLFEKHCFVWKTRVFKGTNACYLVVSREFENLADLYEPRKLLRALLLYYKAVRSFLRSGAHTFPASRICIRKLITKLNKKPSC